MWLTSATLIVKLFWSFNVNSLQLGNISNEVVIVCYTYQLSYVKKQVWKKLTSPCKINFVWGIMTM